MILGHSQQSPTSTRIIYSHNHFVSISQSQHKARTTAILIKLDHIYRTLIYTDKNKRLTITSFEHGYVFLSIKSSIGPEILSPVIWEGQIPSCSIPVLYKLHRTPNQCLYNHKLRLTFDKVKVN